jgi:hypothetical protein
VGFAVGASVDMMPAVGTHVAVAPHPAPSVLIASDTEQINDESGMAMLDDPILKNEGVESQSVSVFVCVSMRLLMCECESSLFETNIYLYLLFFVCKQTSTTCFFPHLSAEFIILCQRPFGLLTSKNANLRMH